MITIIDTNGEEFVHHDSDSLLPSLPRHGGHDVDVVVYRNREWLVMPMSSLRIGDFFRKMSSQTSLDTVFAVTKNPQVVPHPARNRDPDILLQGLKASTLANIYREQGLPGLTKKGIPFSPSLVRIPN